MQAVEKLLTGEEPGTPKVAVGGAQRAQPIAETLERIRPALPRAGITRLADITGLDSLGIPVTLAVRPNGRVLSVSSGKGLTTEAALVSGAMEALELHHAEVEWQPPTVRRSYEEIKAAYPVPDLADLPLVRAAPFPRDWPYLWTWGWDLVAGENVALPVAMIHMGFRDRRVHELFSFQVTSNGLASGNTLVEAVHGGLLEVIERDAVTCHTERWRHGNQPGLVDLDGLDFPHVADLVERLGRAKVATVLFDCTIDTATPVYMAHIVDVGGQIAGTFSGYGAHLDPEIAMVRAITEAVQARTVTIAGSRDDLYRHRDVGHRLNRTRWQEWNEARSAGSTAAAPPPAPATATFEEEVTLLLNRLREAGLNQVIVVDLSVPHFPMSAVKVVVPGLEGYRVEDFVPGRRATALANAAMGAAA